MHWFRIHILISVFCLYHLSCLGTGHSFSKLSIENGLSNNQVNTIFKDSNGFIWIGTLDGLDRYDGIEIRSYSDRFSDEIGSVQTLNEDVHSNLWIGTTTGLFRYNQKVDSFESVHISPENIGVQVLAMLPDSNLCVGTANGLYAINIHSFQSKKLALPRSLGDQPISITGIFPDNQSNCWITSAYGLVRYSFPEGKSELFQCKLTPQIEYNSFAHNYYAGDLKISAKTRSFLL